MYCIFNGKIVNGNNNGKKGTKCIKTALGVLKVKSIKNNIITTNYGNYKKNNKNNSNKKNINFGRVVSRIGAKKHCIQSIKKYKNIFNCIRGKYNNTIKKINVAS